MIKKKIVLLSKKLKAIHWHGYFIWIIWDSLFVSRLLFLDHIWCFLYIFSLSGVSCIFFFFFIFFATWSLELTHFRHSFSLFIVNDSWVPCVTSCTISCGTALAACFLSFNKIYQWNKGIFVTSNKFTFSDWHIWICVVRNERFEPQKSGQLQFPELPISVMKGTRFCGQNIEHGGPWCWWRCPKISQVGGL